MGLFGKSFEEKVEDALTTIRGMGLGIKTLLADIDGKVVTLKGNVESRDDKFKIMKEFNSLVETENTLNLIKVVEAAEPAPADPEEALTTDRIYEVQRGDTLGKIANEFYGKASQYMKIFEANRDILDNPDLIKVGQKLRIPE